MTDDMPRTSKGAAVEQWENAVEDFAELADFLREMDIHDREDRAGAEEIIDHIGHDRLSDLHDAFDDLENEFGDDWW